MMRNFKEKGLIWPLIVVLLLLGSVFTMGSFIFMANSDGGAIVVEGYYEKAVQWDSLSAARVELSKRKWLPSLQLSSEGGSLTLFDSTGTKIPGKSGSVAMNQPHLNPGSERIPLEFIHSDSTYRFGFTQVQSGLWDFTFRLQDSATNVEFNVRKTLQ